MTWELHLLIAIAHTQREHGTLLEHIASLLDAGEPGEQARLLEMSKKLKVSHDRLAAALAAAPPTPKP